LINVFVNAAVKVGLYNTWRFIDSLTNIGFSGRTVCQKICLLTVTNHCFTWCARRNFARWRKV